ncbi:MAG TPA: SDR family NAD(P)-dependent oxidoreductase, partial [Ramlibacter sp.]|nr:SDR family NAD(P)-dependent oxidoreductase [Ramlibacter sp.]
MSSAAASGSRLQGKIALVTGAGAGIGRSVALRFAAEGATVLAASRGDNVQTLVGEAQGEVVPVHCDVSDPAQVATMIAACGERFGRLDVLVNNAGIAHAPARLHELELDTWDRVMATNLRGAFLVLKYALGLMRDTGGGAIVNMASYGSIRASAGSSAYIVSKAAMHSLTQQVAVEYAQ